MGSQMPRLLISDAHAWIYEIPIVPIYYLAKPQPRERAWQNHRGKKTLLSFTLSGYIRCWFSQTGYMRNEIITHRIYAEWFSQTGYVRSGIITHRIYAEVIITHRIYREVIFTHRIYARHWKYAKWNHVRPDICQVLEICRIYFLREAGEWDFSDLSFSQTELNNV